MYSPKIDERLIPVLYHTAKDREVPMTRLVDRLLYQALAMEVLPDSAYEDFISYDFSDLLTSKRNGTNGDHRQALSESPLVRLVSTPFSSEGEIDEWRRSGLAGLGRAMGLKNMRLLEDGLPPNRFGQAYQALYHAMEAVSTECRNYLNSDALDRLVNE